MTETSTNPNRQVGDVSGFAEIQNGIDDLRAKISKIRSSTSCATIDTVDQHLFNAMSSLEDYFQWAGCYDDEDQELIE